MVVVTLHLENWHSIGSQIVDYLSVVLPRSSQSLEALAGKETFGNFLCPMSSLTLKSGTISSTNSYTLEVSTRPTIRGQLDLNLKTSLSLFSHTDFVSVWQTVKALVFWVNSDTENKVRYGVGTDDGKVIHLFPLCWSLQTWQPMRAAERPFNEVYFGYLSTNSGPLASEAYLLSTQKRIANVSGWSTPSFAFQDPTDDNLFAKLVRGEIPQWRVWEDEHHIAFLTPFPNIPGLTVVIPRRHLSSDILSLEDEEFAALVNAARTVYGILKTALRVERVGMFMEGFEIDYAHVKLLPIPMEQGVMSVDAVGTFHEDYQGYLTTQPGPEKSAEELDISAHLRKFLSER